jgi:Tfp pilus assembly protein PilV
MVCNMKSSRDSRTLIGNAADEQGSSLIEILVATLIFTVAFLSIAEMVMYSIMVARNADMTTTLTAAGIDKLEELRSLEYDDVLLNALAPATPQEDPMPGNPDVSRMWTVETDFPYAGLKRITVVTTMMETTFGARRSLTLYAYKTENLVSEPVH